MFVNGLYFLTCYVFEFGYINEIVARLESQEFTPIPTLGEIKFENVYFAYKNGKKLSALSKVNYFLFNHISIQSFYFYLSIP